MVKILSITKITPQITADISVGGNHSYIILLNGGKKVISHNTVSLLAGCTPGCHYPFSPFYVRRVRLPNTSPHIPALLNAGFSVEPCIGSEKTTSVVSFPIRVENCTEKDTTKNISVWEKVNLAIFLQRYWSNNQVSCTIDFNIMEKDDLVRILKSNAHELKSISFLPNNHCPQVPYEEFIKLIDVSRERFETIKETLGEIDGITDMDYETYRKITLITPEEYAARVASVTHSTAYPQMPYEAITEAEYLEMSAKVHPEMLDFRSVQRSHEEELDTHCDGDKCTR